MTKYWMGCLGGASTSQVALVVLVRNEYLGSVWFTWGAHNPASTENDDPGRTIGPEEGRNDTSQRPVDQILFPKNGNDIGKEPAHPNPSEAGNESALPKAAWDRVFHCSEPVGRPKGSHHHDQNDEVTGSSEGGPIRFWNQQDVIDKWFYSWCHDQG